jgi:lipoate synthase
MLLSKSSCVSSISNSHCDSTAVVFRYPVATTATAAAVCAACTHRCAHCNVGLCAQSKVVDEDVYQRQGDNIITWCEPMGLDLALSFQENSGCLEIWGQVSC